jgi:formyl-CoA transferase
VDDVVTAAVAARLPVAPVRTYAESAADPHVLARDMLQPVIQEDGSEAPIVGPAAKLARTPVAVRSGAPALGAHTDAILEDLGYDADARGRLREAGAI